MTKLDPLLPCSFSKSWINQWEGLNITQAAERIDIKRSQLSYPINGRIGLSAKMALKLSEEFPRYTAEELLSLQNIYDLAVEKKLIDKVETKHSLTKKKHSTKHPENAHP